MEQPLLADHLANGILAERDELDAIVKRLLGDACPIYVSGGYREWLDDLDEFATRNAAVYEAVAAALVVAP